MISNLWILFQIILWSSWLLLFSHSVVFNSLRPCGLEHTRLTCPSPSLLKLMSTELVMSSNHLSLCRPLLLLSSVFPIIRVFSNESALPIRWPKYWSFSISPSNEYLGLISFRIDWFDLISLKSILVHRVAPYRESPCPRQLLKRLHWRELFRAAVLTQVSINTPPQGAGRKPATQIHFLSLSLASPSLLRMGILFAPLHPKS